MSGWPAGRLRMLPGRAGKPMSCAAPWSISSSRVAAWRRSLQLAEELPGPVVAALRTVPRHLFTPGVPLARAYENAPVVIKADERGAGLSPVSAPGAIAGMLAQLDVRPGESVLEIGSGGYQAALLRELAGPHGSVTTLDIDPGRHRPRPGLPGPGRVRRRAHGLRGRGSRRARGRPVRQDHRRRADLGHPAGLDRAARPRRPARGPAADPGADQVVGAGPPRTGTW